MPAAAQARPWCVLLFPIYRSYVSRSTPSTVLVDCCSAPTLVTVTSLHRPFDRILIPWASRRGSCGISCQALDCANSRTKTQRPFAHHANIIYLFFKHYPPRRIGGWWPIVFGLSSPTYTRIFVRRIKSLQGACPSWMG